MSGEIKILPEDLTNKIAAGEVVERPASIVKELLENAIDAGATDISVALEKGGCAAIRVVDNGGGMEAGDVSLAFERYATSKIYQFDDIYTVRSFGFRGEALPSIASIARVEMVSRKRESLSGTRVVFESGHLKDIGEAGCPAGTSVSVTRIFDPVPVRKKFLKAEATEQGYCMDVMVRTALAHPGVRLKAVINGREVLNIPSTSDVLERVSLVLGADFKDHVLPVRVDRGQASVTGFVSRPDFTRSNSRQIYCYVNSRYIRDYLLNHAVMTAYRRVIDARRYPSAVLFIELPPEDVDVNVHPAKMEVRFRNPREIYEMIVEAAGVALSGAATAAGTEKAPMPYGDHAGRREYQARVAEALKRYTVSSGSGKLFFKKDDVSAKPEPAQDIPFVSESLSIRTEAAPPAVVFSDLSCLGQIADTYLVFQAPDGMILLDQHAAHERVLFERFRRTFPSEKMISQQLLLPEVISLPPRDFRFIMESLDLLADAGIDVEAFGVDTVIVKSIPAPLGHLDARALIMDMLDEVSETERQAGVKDRRDRIYVSLACRGAVKANRRLSPPEVAALCRDLDATPFSSTCPHGRPVYLSLTVASLEKMFKRR